MAEAAKVVRASAKGRFTRSVNRVEEAIADDETLEEVQSLFSDVSEAYEKMMQKNDLYLQEEGAVEGDWLEEPEATYTALRKKVGRVERLSKENIEKLDLESIIRHHESIFSMAIRRVDVVLSGKCSKDLIEQEKMNLYKVFDNLQEKYKELCTHTEHPKMMLTQEETFMEYKIKIDRYMSNLEMKSLNEKNEREIQMQKERSKIGFQMDKLPLPKFDGNIRSYHRFKGDFHELILPKVSDCEAAFTLRQCLVGDVKEYLSGCEDDVSEMFAKLDRKFGDNGKIMDMIISEIKSFPKIRENDPKAVVIFVNMVERGERDLSKLKLKDVISNPYIVSVIEAKLPKDVSLEWCRKVKKPNSDIKLDNKFVKLLTFLQTWRDALEYGASNIRTNNMEGKRSDEFSRKSKDDSNRTDDDSVGCWHHAYIMKNHSITNCNIFLSKTNVEKVNTIREKGACWNCLLVGHRGVNCPEKRKCGVNNCERFHHPLLHPAHLEGAIFHSSNEHSQNSEVRPCLLLIMKSQAKSEKHGRVVDVNTLWDSAATISMITNDAARKLGLRGQPVSLTIVKAGGTSERISSFKYTINIYDECGTLIELVAYGIPKISTSIKPIKINSVVELFPGTCNADVTRPEGEVDLLVGLDYAAFHPQIIQNKDHLVLYRNRFGKCLGGTHPMLVESTERVIESAYVNFLSASMLEEFFAVELVEGEKSDYSIKEARELKLISSRLKYNGEYWKATLPWIRDPKALPNNEFVALSILKSTEKRILKDQMIADAYKKQMDDMFARGVARKLSDLELNDYNGPIHYITHHEVLKADSASTPLRIVFNTSLSFHGHTLNGYWAKGPDIVNNMFGVFLRFREEKIAFVGDISKMYHAVRMLDPVDQNTHRFLWRDLNLQTKPSTYVVTRISFGDRPAGIIANLALRNTAEFGKQQYPRACETVVRNAYVDDIIDSTKDELSAKRLTAEIQSLLLRGDFKVKGWIFTGCSGGDPVSFVDGMEDLSKEQVSVDGAGSSSTAVMQKVLGMNWDYKQDSFFFTVKLNFSAKRRNIRTGPDILREEFPSGVPVMLTKRMILQQVNGFYDIFGLATPFILKAKILLRSLWIGENKGLDWDDVIPNNEYSKWIRFFEELYLMEDLNFPRCMKPENAASEEPILVMFSDASEAAYGAVAYVRWKLNDGTYCSRIMASKSKLAPVKRITTVRLELNGAVLAKRLKGCILRESRYKFRRVYFIVDSEIVLGMIQKDSYGFKTYIGVRVAEIQNSTKAENWHWIDGDRNIADWTTRGQHPHVLDTNGLWQNGPLFLRSPENDWPIKQSCKLLEIPEMIKSVMVLDVTNEAGSMLFDIDRFSKYSRLIRTTCRVLSVFGNCPSIRNISREPETSDYEQAEIFWIKQCQSQFCDRDVQRLFARLSPQKRHDGIWIVGARAEKWVEASYNNEHQILLPFKHRFSRLYAEFVHNITHAGVLSTVSRIRLKFWIVNLQKMVKSIVHHCVPCKIKRQEVLKQIMAPFQLNALNLHQHGTKFRWTILDHSQLKEK